MYQITSETKDGHKCTVGGYWTLKSVLETVKEIQGYGAKDIVIGYMDSEGELIKMTYEEALKSLDIKEKVSKFSMRFQKCVL